MPQFNLIPRIRPLLLIALAAGVAACSNTGSPTGLSSPSSEIEEAIAASDALALEVDAPPVALPSVAGVVISPNPPVAGTKRGLPLVQEKKIGKKGGSLTVLGIDGKTLVHFRVPKNALDATEKIRMEVVGSGASTESHFDPSGLHFNEPCKLILSIPKGDISPDDLGGYLLNEDGTVTEVPHVVRVIGKRIYVIISVSHFSIYAPGDGESGAHDNEGGGNYYDPYAYGAP